MPTPDTSNILVTGVLVSHNGENWLPQALASLARLTVVPDRFVAVDAGSTDTTAQLLDGAAIFDAVLPSTFDGGFGASVRQALDIAPPGAGEWVWLLHDDVEVAPDALAKLMECAAAFPDADVIGPKLLRPLPTDGPADEPQRILELGQTISNTGRIELGIEPGEIDQRQHTSAPVLGVSSCGVLVRRKVFDELGGFAPEVPVIADGLEFGWRATAAGHHVRTCPDALIVHHQAGRSGERPSPMLGERPAVTERLMALRTVAAHQKGGGARLATSSLSRAFGYLLAKAPSLASAELAALKALNGPETAALRNRSPQPDADTQARIAALRPGKWHSWQRAAEAVNAEVSTRWRADEDPDTDLDDLTGDDFAGVQHGRRSIWSNPVIIGLVTLVIAALVSGRQLLRLGQLHAPQLLPARPDLAEALRAYLAPIPGAPGLSAPPWLGWVALGSTATLGQPEWFSTLLVWGCVPLAFLTAQSLLRRTAPDLRLRIPFAGLYALTPVLLGATNRGNLSLGLWAVLLPLLAVTARAMVLRRTHGAESWRSAWATGLLLSILLAFEPSVGLLALLLAATAAIFLRDDRDRLLRLMVALGVPILLLLPWLPSLFHGWSRLLVGPDAGLGTLDVATGWSLLFGLTPGGGQPPLWLLIIVFGVVWALALLAAAVRTERIKIWVAWSVALVGLAMAQILAKQTATALPYGTKVRPDVSVWLLIVFGALLAVGAAGFDKLAETVAEARRPLASRLTTVTSVVAAAALLLGLGWWVWAGASGPIKRDQLADLPPYLRNAMSSPAATRVLAIELRNDTVSWSLIADRQLRLGDADRGLAFAGSNGMQDKTRSIVGRLVGGTGDEQIAGELNQLAVSHLWVTGASEEQKAKITNTPGLGAASGDEEAVVWSIPATVGRAAVTGAGQPIVVDLRDGSAEVDLPAGEGPRRLQLAEPADPRWRVTFAGRPIDGQHRGDQGNYDLPAAPGRLTVTLSDPLRPWIAGAQLLGVIVVLVLAGPSLSGSRQRRREVRDSRGGGTPMRVATTEDAPEQAPTRAAQAFAEEETE